MMLTPAPRRLPAANFSSRRRLVGLVCLGLLWGPGCNNPVVQDNQNISTRAPNDDDVAAGPDAAAAAENLGYETWYVIQARGRQLGFEHTRWYPDPDSDSGQWRFESKQVVVIARQGDQAKQFISVKSWEDAQGGLLHFEAVYDSGGEQSVTQGRLEGSKLQMQTTTHGQQQGQALDWPANGLGLSAPLSLFLRHPPSLGEQGEFVTLAPVINQLATVRWFVAANESMDLEGGSRELLRVDLDMTLPQANNLCLKQAIWLDPQGRPYKLVDQQTGMTWLKASREAAQAPVEDTSFDLNQWISAPVTGNMPARPDSVRLIRYRATLKDGDPSTVFRQSQGQQVRSLGPHVAQLSVAAQPAAHAAAEATQRGQAPAPPTPDDTASSLFVQCAAPEIQALAEQAARGLQDPRQVALALERFVHGYITKKGYGRAFQTALQTAQTREGDCTEHAVLLAALCRARGLPARVVTGLIYHQQAFAYHMWNEVWIAGQWVPLDATLGRGGIGPTHLAIGQANLKGSDAFADLLPIMSVLGQLSLEVESFE